MLEGLDPVRKRPGMYIGSTGLAGLHHLIWEVVDNAVDEAMAGFCTRIGVTLLADGGCRVDDNGRGIPVDPYPSGPHKGKSAAEVVLTVLHAGGKFGGEGYKVSGGLHGVGVSVVNALSERLILEVDRDGTPLAAGVREGRQAAGQDRRRRPHSGAQRRAPAAPPSRSGRIPRCSSPRAPSSSPAPCSSGCRRWRSSTRASRSSSSDERPDREVQEVTYLYKGGIVDFVKHLNASKEALFSKVAHYEDEDDEGGQTLDIAIQWNTGYHEGIHGYANGISTIEGGMHVEGFKTALTNVVNKYARTKNLLKEKEENFLGEDIREGITAIVSVKLREPQFEGQTKAKLGNVPMRSFVQKATNERLAEWLEENPAEANRLVKKAQAAAQARVAAKNARNAIRRKTALSRRRHARQVEGLLAAATRTRANCSSSRATRPAARRSNARDPRTQAMLPIRGKILNVERARLDKMLKNNEVQNLITAIGGGVGDEFESAKARYHKVILLADADVDGSHIRTLLLTFFYRQMRPLVEAGYVYIAQPPLFSTVVGKEKIYLKDETGQGRLARGAPQPQEGVPAPEGPRRDGLGGAEAHHHGRRARAPCCRSRWKRRRSPTR